MLTDPTTDYLLHLKAAALDCAGDAVIVIDREGIIRVWNSAAQRLFGWTAEQTIGQDVKIMIPERLRSSHDRGFFAAMASGHLHSDGRPRHTKAAGPGGETIYVTMSFAVVSDAAGAAIGSVAMAREWIREPRHEPRPAAVGAPARDSQ
ncbi:MAG: PAS domain-containing protein [Propioniciclava sp.]|uniref:PAS domain-containing protein n=1 Tax=Propioniciclava sp. TaxID=2038686 RepID=UPI0039E4B184